VGVLVFVSVGVRVGVDVAVEVRVAVEVTELVREEVNVNVGEPVGDTEVVDDGDAVIEEVGVSVPKTPMGMTVAAPVFMGWRVNIESLQAGGVRISWLMGSTTTKRCFT